MEAAESGPPVEGIEGIERIERIEVTRRFEAPAAAVFAVLTDPQGHVAIDASGMLQSADGDPVRAVGDEFVVHMDRESLGDLDLGRYDVTVRITQYEQDRLLAWDVLGRLRPQIGHVYGYRLEPAADSTEGAETVGATLVTSFYDWSGIDPVWRERAAAGQGIAFPIISAANLRATLGILDRTVQRGYPRA